jgi:type III pantothenate kinase
MRNTRRHVLIDAGNTRIKWASWTHGEPVIDALTVEIAATADDARLLAAVAGCDGLWIACVAGAATRADLAHALTPLQTPCWLLATAAACGVRNAYDAPTTLGVDRWLALIGARARGAAATLVVSAGTALTVDALDAQGVFLGGFIAPGLGTMRESLAQATAGVRPAGGQSVAFPRNTADAVASGTLAALAGAARTHYAQLAAVSGEPPRCLLTGGDAATLASQFDPTPAPSSLFSGIAPDIVPEIVPALVLEGMAAWITEQLSA